MSGTPSEAEIQTQWKAAVNCLEKTRNYIDGTVMGAGGLFDTMLQALEGDYTPEGLAAAGASLRASLSGCIDQQRALAFLEPIVWEYGKKVTPTGTPNNLRDVMRALYEWFKTNTYSIPSRTITFDTSATTSSYSAGTIVGNGAVSRLTVDENNYPLEAVTVETKILRCVQDETTGRLKGAERWLCNGAVPNFDATLRGSYGSGVGPTIYTAHAGSSSGAGSSILRNSSFDTFSSTATNKFDGWTALAGGTLIDQDTTAAHYYIAAPGSVTDGALKITASASTTVTLAQYLTDMRESKLDANRPYFLRVMVNKSVGAATGGNFIVRIGSKTITTAIASLSAGWNEITITLDKYAWPRNFNQTDLSVQVEWAQSTSTGYLLVDDVILTPWDFWDGSYWIVRHNNTSPTAWRVDDALAFTDTGGAAGTGKLQWWLWIAGLGYLPTNGGSPTIADPT